MILYVLLVHFSGIFYHVRYLEKLEKLKFYEGLYKKENQGTNLRRLSEQNKRLSLLGGLNAAEFAHMFNYTVYEKCRSINIAVKLLLLVGLFVICLLSVLDSLPQKAYYELAIMIFVELGAYVFYIDYIPKLSIIGKDKNSIENSKLEDERLSSHAKPKKTNQDCQNDSCAHLIPESNYTDTPSCLINNSLFSLDQTEMNSLDFSGPDGFQVPACFIIQKLQSLVKNIN
jgi:hypothetical protein